MISTKFSEIIPFVNNLFSQLSCRQNILTTNNIKFGTAIGREVHNINFTRRYLMKHILFISFICISIQGLCQSHNVEMAAQGDLEFKVLLDGIETDSLYESSVSFYAETGRYYNVEIEFNDSTLSNLKRNTLYLEKGQSKIYSLRKLNSKEVTLRLEETNTSLISNDQEVQVRSMSSKNENQLDVQIEMPDREVMADSEDIENDSLNMSILTEIPDYNGMIGCSKLVDSFQFESIKSSIEEKEFEDSRLKSCKQNIAGKCMSTDQIKSILKLLSYEESRLEVAKFAFEYTHDIENYHLLNEVFSFGSSKKELEQYLKSK